MSSTSTMALDEALCDLLVAAALYEAAHRGLEIAVAGRWELEVAVRDRVRRLGAQVHENPGLRADLSAWLEDGIGRMQASTVAMHVSSAGRGIVRRALTGRD